MRVYYSVVEIADRLFAVGQADEPAPARVARLLNAAAVVSREVVAELTAAKANLAADDDLRLRLIQHSQEVVDLIQELERRGHARRAS